MEESYENLKNTHESIIKEFEVENEQNGVLIILNGEIQGFELFLNPEIYREFHKKILKSYIIDSKIENNTFAVNVEDARDIISKTLTSSLKKEKTLVLRKSLNLKMMTVSAQIIPIKIKSCICPISKTKNRG